MVHLQCTLMIETLYNWFTYPYGILAGKSNYEVFLEKQFGLPWTLSVKFLLINIKLLKFFFHTLKVLEETANSLQLIRNTNI